MKNSENLVHMILRLNNDKICLIKMDKKRNLQMEDYYMYDKIPETLFKKYYDLFKLMCTYAIVYNYNDNRRLNTISNEFQILPYFNKFCITMPSKILSECYKHMYLSHYYEKPQYIKSENIINTDIGNFELETNIREIKKLLNVKSNFENVQIDNVVRFLQNLQVYESDIPEYIKPELQKIKSLKK